VHQTVSSGKQYHIACGRGDLAEYLLVSPFTLTDAQTNLNQKQAKRMLSKSQTRPQKYNMDGIGKKARKEALAFSVNAN
jgi:hypothetical protein